MSTLVVNKLQDSTGREYGKALAWVNFNGTGTVAIRKAMNVNSITDNGVGDYTVNFTAALPDANFSMAGMGTQTTGNANVVVCKENATAPTTTASRITTTQSATRIDVDYVNVVYFD